MKMMIGKLGRIFDRILNVTAVIAAVMLLFTMFEISTEVFMRLVWGKSIFWSIEIAALIMLYMTFIASAWLLRGDEHVRMELVINYLGQRQRAILNIVTSVISTLVFLALTWVGTQSVIFFAKTGQYMPTDLEPPTYLIISIIPLGSFLLFIQGIRKTFEYLRAMSSAPSGGD